jgi:regulator of sigma E protease
MAGETVEDEREGRDDEFLSKTKWQRFQILIAGPAMNVVLAVLVMTVVLLQGAQVPLYEEQPPVIGSVAEDSPAEQAGILPGDRILSVAGRPVDTWEELMLSVMDRPDREVEVALRRAGEVRAVRVTPVGRTEYNLGDVGVGPDVAPQVMGWSPQATAARDAGIEIGDVIEAVDGRRVTQQALIEAINGSAGAPVALRIRREGATEEITLAPEQVGDAWMIGVSLSPYEVRVVEPGLFEAFTLSLEQNYEWSQLIFRTLWGLLTRETPASQLVGPVGIAQLSGDAAQIGWVTLLRLMAMISLNLGILNLLPIPILDGGHITVLAMEGIARRDFSVRLKERMLLAGFVVLMTLMVTVIYNDLTRVAWIERLMIWR